MANLAGIDTPHANFQKSKIFKKFPKRGTKNVKNPKFYFFRKINAKFGFPMVILVGIDTKHAFLKKSHKKVFLQKYVKSIYRNSQEILGL